MDSMAQVIRAKMKENNIAIFGWVAFVWEHKTKRTTFEMKSTDMHSMRNVYLEAHMDMALKLSGPTLPHAVYVSCENAKLGNLCVSFQWCY